MCILQKHSCLCPLVHRCGLRSQAPGWRGGRPVAPACANLCRCVCHFCMCCLVCFLLSPGWALKTHRIPWTGGTQTQEASCLSVPVPPAVSVWCCSSLPQLSSPGVFVLSGKPGAGLDDPGGAFQLRLFCAAKQRWASCRKVSPRWWSDPGVVLVKHPLVKPSGTKRYRVAAGWMNRLEPRWK